VSLAETRKAIHRLSERRQAIWDRSVIGEEGETDRIATELHHLFAEKREYLAGAGSSKRERIMRAARIEGELEDLIIDPEKVISLHKRDYTPEQIAQALDARPKAVRDILRKYRL
jgi:hypothetical protein